MTWTDDDQRHFEQAGTPARLVLVDPTAPAPAQLREWIAEGEGLGLHRRLYCRRRDPWFAITDDRRPDAFLRYMGQAPPRIVLNDAAALSTNAIHRLWWTDRRISPAAVAVVSCTSLFALGCERMGRSYGGGVLKIEPSAACSLPVPIVPAAEAALATIDALLRANRSCEARALANRVVLLDGLGLDTATVESLEHACQALARRRTALDC